MHLLQAGVDLTVIALWLGHESTTHMYVDADLAMKERALNALQPLCLDDAALIDKLGLTEQARPINFEVMRHITSGAIEVDKD